MKRTSAVFLFALFICAAARAENPMDQNNMPSQADDRTQEQMGGQINGPPRVPPQPAIDACIGKSEGDACQVSTPNGDKSGDCQWTPDKQYFACRPDDMKMPPPQEQDKGQDPQGQTAGY